MAESIANTSAADTDVTAQLAALRETYSSQLTGTLQALRQRVAGQGPDIDVAVLEEIEARLHKLAGSGATFGFVKLSEKARQLERTVDEWVNAGAQPSEGSWLAWKADLLRLHETLEAPLQAHKTVAVPTVSARPDSAIRWF